MADERQKDVHFGEKSPQQPDQGEGGDEKPDTDAQRRAAERAEKQAEEASRHAKAGREDKPSDGVV